MRISGSLPVHSIFVSVPLLEIWWLEAQTLQLYSGLTTASFMVHSQSNRSSTWRVRAYRHAGSSVLVAVSTAIPAERVIKNPLLSIYAAAGFEET